MQTKYVESFDEFPHGKEEDENQTTNELSADWILQYIKSGEPFGLVSAFQPDESTAANKKANDLLKKEVIRCKYGYKEMTVRCRYPDNGGMTEARQSILFIPKIPMHPLLRLGEKYGQELIAIKGETGLDFIKVSNEQLVFSINAEDLSLTWGLSLFGNHMMAKISTL